MYMYNKFGEIFLVHLSVVLRNSLPGVLTNWVVILGGNRPGSVSILAPVKKDQWIIFSLVMASSLSYLDWLCAAEAESYDGTLIYCLVVELL